MARVETLFGGCFFCFLSVASLLQTLVVMTKKLTDNTGLNDAKNITFRLKKQLLSKKRFFYFQKASVTEMELKVSEFGGDLENSSVVRLKLELKPN